MAAALPPLSREDCERSLVERFEAQAARQAGRVAVRAADATLTYAELDRAADRVAHAILARRGDGEEPVAFFLEQGARPVVAMLGILKAGKAYVPLDPGYPPARNAHGLADSGAALIVVDGRTLPRARELAPAGIELLDLDALDAAPSGSPGLRLGPDRLAYIMYTSGSTGRPKGVMGTHRSVLHEMLRNTVPTGVGPEDRQTLLRSVAFNGAVRDVFCALLSGASVHPLDVGAVGARALAGWLATERITIYRSVVSTYRDLATTLTPADRFPDLRLVNIGGEPIHRSDVDLFRRHFDPRCVLICGLGITEVGLARQYVVDRHTELSEPVVPVGYAVDGVEVLLLDEAGRPVGPDVTGEIAVRSRYLSAGYWRQPALTTQRFLPDPAGGDERLYLTGDLGVMRPDGCLLHRGRRDFQVKIRGQRVETEEVEAALLGLPGVSRALVTARADREEARLIAYVVPTGSPAPGVGALRRGLAASLPAAMIPSAFVMLEAMPLNALGKVDRAALPAPDRARPALDAGPIAPRTPLERALAALWAEALGLDAIGVADDFLELGGDSLLATRILTRVTDAFGVDLPRQALFEAPTVAAMAAVITQRHMGEMDPADLERLLARVEGA